MDAAEWVGGVPITGDDDDHVYEPSESLGTEVSQQSSSHDTSSSGLSDPPSSSSEEEPPARQLRP
jgi:hypothetical protein